MDEQNLKFVLEVVDNASAVIDQVNDQIKLLSGGSNELSAALGTQARMLEELKAKYAGTIAATNQTAVASAQATAAVDAENAAVIEQAAAITRDTIAAEQLAKAKLIVTLAAKASGEALTIEQEAIYANYVAQQTLANSTSGLTGKIQAMGTRFLLHAVIIGTVIGAINYLKSATEESEKANKAYTDQFTAADKTIAKFKVTIGNDLLPSFELLKQTFADLIVQSDATGDHANALQEVFNFLGKVVASTMVIIVGGIKLLGDMIKTTYAYIKDFIINVGKGFSDLVAGIKAVFAGDWEKAWTSFADIPKLKWDDVKKANAAGEKDTLDTANELKKIWGTNMNVKLSDTPYTKPTKDNSELKNKLKDLQDAYKQVQANAADALQELQANHDDKISQIQGKLSDLKDTYTQTVAEEQTQLKSLADANTTAMKTIADQISKVQESMAQLGTELADKQNQNISDLATAFVKAKDSLVDLQDQLNNWKTPDAIANTQFAIYQLNDQLAAATTANDKAYIQAQIDQQGTALQTLLDNNDKEKQSVQDKITATQATLASSKDLQLQYADQIAAAEKYNNETALQQAIDKFNTEQVLAQKDHDTKMANFQDEIAQLNAKANLETQKYNESVARLLSDTKIKTDKITAEMADYTKQQNDEQLLYYKKVMQIDDIIMQAEQYRRDQTNQTTKNTIDSVNKEIDAYNNLATAIRNAQSAKYTSTVSMSAAASIPKLAEGGIVNGPTIALIGEAGREAVVPLDRASSMGFGGGSGPVVNITINGDVSGEEIAEKIGDRLVNILKFSTATV